MSAQVRGFRTPGCGFTMSTNELLRIRYLVETTTKKFPVNTMGGNKTSEHAEPGNSKPNSFGTIGVKVAFGWSQRDPISRRKGNGFFNRHLENGFKSGRARGRGQYNSKTETKLND